MAGNSVENNQFLKENHNFLYTMQEETEKNQHQNYFYWCFFPKDWEFSHKAQEQCLKAEQQSCKFSKAMVKEN